VNGLSGARVIIVDDDEDDALPVLKAFARKGIPAAFFDGTIGELPPKSGALSGVRLAVLDMDLVGGGASEKAKAAALVTRLERILRPDNGPYIALLWTNQPELREQFEKYTYANENLPNPILTVLLTKAECKTTKGKFRLSVVAQKLEEALTQAVPLQVLQSWEERCFGAATAVTNALAKLAEPDVATLDEWRDQWQSQLLTLMHAMAKAEMGANLNADCCTEGLYSLLNPLHADRMESHDVTVGSAEILAAPAGTTVRQRAEVNTMLHLAFENLQRFSPGNIYVFPRKTMPEWIASNIQLAADLSNSGRLKEVRKSGRRILIESSAVCDHAQGNLRMHRLVTGLLIPADKHKSMKKKAPFVFELGPFHLKAPLSVKEGDYNFYFSARHEVTRGIAELNELKAVARLRTQALSDLQAWYSRQSARPGMVMLAEN
jgi:hypothetical protein